MKISVLLHLFYPDMWKDIKNKLSNLTHPYKLYVNLTENFYDDSIIQELKLFKSDVVINISENKGVAILGFLRLLKLVDNDTDLLLTLHTKKSLGLPNKPSDMVKMYGYSSAVNKGKEWFELAINGVLGDKDQVNSIIQKFKTNQNCGMIGYNNSQTFVGTNRPMLKNLINTFNLDPSVIDKPFVDGAMFWVRYNIFKKYFTDDKINLLEQNTPTGYLNEPSINHALERIFGYIVPNERKQINVEFTDSMLTFVTHLRYDHQDRISNLQYILDYYSSCFPKARFVLVEDDIQHSLYFDSIKWPKKKTSFYFFENKGLYHRTKALNYGIKQSKTPVVVSLDTDCLVSPISIKLCANELLNGSTVAWPYNGYFIDTAQQFKTQILDNTVQFSVFDKYIPILTNLNVRESHEYFSIRGTNKEPRCVGGIVMFNKEKFLNIGGYNEKFIAWGAEDEELVHRCNILNQKCYRDENLNSVLFHLNHHNALRSNHQFYNSNVDELVKVSKMSKLELENYIKTWG